MSYIVLEYTIIVIYIVFEYTITQVLYVSDYTISGMSLADEIRRGDKQGLDNFKEKYPDSELFLITKDWLKDEEEIKMIPL